MTLNTEDFLWRLYFGIAKTEAQKNPRDALRKCIDRAFADMQRTVDYKYSSSRLEELSDDNKKQFIDEKKDFKKKKKDIIYTGITKSLFKIGPNDLEKKFRQKHEIICDKLCDKYKNMKKSDCLKSNLTYGQAQKWLNMTFKYMAIMGLWSKSLNRIEGYLDVPLDRIIIKAVFHGDTRMALIKRTKGGEALFNTKKVDESYNCANSEGELHYTASKEGVTKNSELCKAGKKDASYIAWSNIQYYENYKKVQGKIKECIPEGMSPLEWENKVWLAASKLEDLRVR